MREFFIFELKDEFKNLYIDKPSILYNIFEQIYTLKKEELNYGYSLFRQLTKKIDKDKTKKKQSKYKLVQRKRNKIVSNENKITRIK